jgi:hypothetical protein
MLETGSTFKREGERRQTDRRVADDNSAYLEDRRVAENRTGADRRLVRNHDLPPIQWP